MDLIYDEYYSKIYNWSLKKTNNKEDAEDLTNSIFLAIFEYFGANVKVDKIENLIWKIAHNIWCTRAKQYIKERNNTTFEETYQTSYEKEATIFKMYYLNDLSIKEISKNTETSESNIKYYLYNARKKIKERYNE